MTTLQIALPDEMIHDLSLSQDALAALAREALLVKLYELGEVSTGKAAAALGVSRREFLDLLGRYNVSEFEETMNLEEEGRVALAASDFKHQSTD